MAKLGLGLVCAALVGGAALMPCGALAQAITDPQAPKPERNAFSGDFLTVGAGFVSMPSYEGSDDRTLLPAIGVMGRVGGIGINPRSAGIALDFVPDPPHSRIGISLGPVVRYRNHRAAHVKDPVVASLGKLASTVEAGIAAGVSLKHLLTHHDALSFGADMRWDVSGHGGGRVLTLGTGYYTPVSRGQIIGFGLGADVVSARYADYNFSIDAAGSTASGLPEFHAKGGFKSWSARAFTAFDLNGNLLDGGFAVGAGLGFTRLVASAAASPITSLRGTRNQWLLATGIAYTF